jgi:hypothetical protein
MSNPPLRLRAHEHGRNGPGPTNMNSPPIPARTLELEQVRNAVRDIRHGEVRVVIQDGLIVQVDRLERHRLC